MMRSTKRAIVMELSRKHAVVMTSDGDFQRVRVDNMNQLAVGQEISVGAGKRIDWRSLPTRSAIAGLAAVVVFGLIAARTLFGGPTTAEAYAFVSVDVNPSVSFQLNKNMDVIRVDGTDKAGVSLAHRLHVKGKPIDAAIRAMMMEVQSEGKLSPKDAVMVTASSPSGKVNLDSVQTQVTADVQQALKSVDEGNLVPAQVYSMNVASTVWNDATKNKVSPSQYASYLLGNEAGVNVKLSQVSTPNMQLAVAQAHDLKSSVKALDKGHLQSVSNIVQGAVARVSQEDAKIASQKHPNANAKQHVNDHVSAAGQVYRHH